MTHPLLSQVPDELLRRTGRSLDESARQRGLLAWLEGRGVRPSLLDVERERWRRGMTAEDPADPSQAARRRRTTTDY